jgi:hypothetical protein
MSDNDVCGFDIGDGESRQIIELQMRIQVHKRFDSLIEKYGVDEFDGAFATEMQFHADEVTEEQIEKIIKNNEEELI